jgi:hypothetical protein
MVTAMRQQPTRQAIYRRPIATAVFALLAIVALTFGIVSALAFWQLHQMKPFGAYEPVRPAEPGMGFANALGARMHAGLSEMQRRAIEQKSKNAWQYLSCSLAAALMGAIVLWYVTRPFPEGRKDSVRHPTPPP